MLKFNKDKIIDKVFAECVNVNKAVVKQVVKKFLENLGKILQEDDEVVIEFRDFGIFEKKESRSKRIINPKTREITVLRKRYTLKFKPSYKIKERLKIK